MNKVSLSKLTNQTSFKSNFTLEYLNKIYHIQSEDQLDI